MNLSYLTGLSSWEAPTIYVSFSGGRTSAYMAHRLQHEYAGKLFFVFANTGCEDERTLIFIERCDQEWGLNLVWLEAVTHSQMGVGNTHRIVNFQTASRNGEPFEAMIKKYGIPNRNFPHCTRELKRRAINHYIRQNQNGDKKYFIAIGIRSDEPGRLRETAGADRIIYPLAHWFPTDKPFINGWWEDQPFHLELLEHEGNCQWCWKKNISKLVRIAVEHPERFDFPLRMEKENGLDRFGKPVTFFRENRSAAQILAMGQMVTPGAVQFKDHPDEDSGCSESCEVY